jgi:hypothetical protein
MSEENVEAHWVWATCAVARREVPACRTRRLPLGGYLCVRLLTADTPATA